MFTLASGSAWAKSSSRCVANDAAQQVHPGVQTGATYLQVQIYTYTKSSSGDSTSSWVKGSDLRAIALAAGVECSWISATQYLCMVGGKPPSGSTDYLAGNIYDNSTNPPSPPSLTAFTGKYYAVSVDSHGNIIGVDSVIKTGSGGAVHATCWSTFR
jgi:hypothetical protein